MQVFISLCGLFKVWPVTLSNDEHCVELFFTFKLQRLKFLSYGKLKDMLVHAIIMGSGVIAPLTVTLCSIWTLTGQLHAATALSNGHSTTGALGIWRIWGCQNWFWSFALEKNFLLLKDMNHFPSVIPTEAYRTDRTILTGLEISNWDIIWSLGDSKCLKYLGCVCVCARAGRVGWCGCRYWFIFLPSECGEFWLQNTDLESMSRKLSWLIFAWQDCERN